MRQSFPRPPATVVGVDWRTLVSGALIGRLGWGPSLVALFTARRGFLPRKDLPWAEEHRRGLEQIRVAALECYAAVALGVGGSELAPGDRVARELVELAPYRERGHALLSRSSPPAATTPKHYAYTKPCAATPRRPRRHPRTRATRAARRTVTPLTAGRSRRSSGLIASAFGKRIGAVETRVSLVA